MALTAAPASLTSIQRSPATAVQGGRRSAMNGTAVSRAAAAAFCRNDSRVGMRGVDQSVDALRDEIVGQARGAAKAADANRHGMRDRRSGAAGERQRHVEIAALGEAFAEQARFRGAAENEDAWHANMPEPLPRDTAASPRWLSIVGIGEDGVDGLSPVARGLIEAAEIVFGGRRHLGACGAAHSRRGAAVAEPVRRRAAKKSCAIAAGRFACSRPATRSTTASARCWRATSMRAR